MKTLLSEFFHKWFTLVTQIYIKYIRVTRTRYSDIFIFIDVMIDDVIGKCNLFESLSSSDDNLTRTEDTACDFLHLMTWLELNLDRRVPIRFERNLKYIIVLLKPSRHQHEIDVIIKTEIGIDHHNPKRIGGEFDRHL